jgi:hypothetical protein
MAAHLDRCYMGEQNVGFFQGPAGYYFIDGPSGAGGHASNAPGFDGLAFNPKTRELIIYDNKAYYATGTVRSASAIDPAKNLEKNLRVEVEVVRAMTHLPDRDVITGLLEDTLSALNKPGFKVPSGVKLVVFNAGGNSRDISAALKGRGIEFIDLSAAPTPAAKPERKYVNSQTVAAVLRRSSDVDFEFMRRVQRAEAVANITAAVVVTLNARTIDRALEARVEAEGDTIAGALTSGVGVLIAYEVLIQGDDLPGGRLGDVTFHYAASPKLAFEKWLGASKITSGTGDHVQVATRFRWLPPMAASRL